MIDYVKILVNNVNTSQLRNRLDFQCLMVENTGEIQMRYVYSFHHCTLTIYPSNRLIFRGSLHKLWNSRYRNVYENYNVKFNDKKDIFHNHKGYNGNQFGYYEFNKIRRYLCHKIGCTSNDMIIQNIEFGFNIETFFDPKLFIKGLLYHKGKCFEHRLGLNYAQCMHQQYLIKIYNKSNQYNSILTEHTLRVEVKLIRSCMINKLGITSLFDINRNSFIKAQSYLKTVFDEIVYFDYTIKKDGLSRHNKLKLDKYKNKLYWIEELNNVKSRYKQKMNLISIIDGNSENLKGIIGKLLMNKSTLINLYHLDCLDKKRVLFNTSSIQLDSHLFCEWLTRNKQTKRYVSYQ